MAKYSPPPTASSLGIVLNSVDHLDYVVQNAGQLKRWNWVGIVYDTIEFLGRAGGELCSTVAVGKCAQYQNVASRLAACDAACPKARVSDPYA